MRDEMVPLASDDLAPDPRWRTWLLVFSVCGAVLSVFFYGWAALNMLQGRVTWDYGVGCFALSFIACVASLYPALVPTHTRFHCTLAAFLVEVFFASVVYSYANAANYGTGPLDMKYLGPSLAWTLIGAILVALLNHLTPPHKAIRWEWSLRSPRLQLVGLCLVGLVAGLIFFCITINYSIVEPWFDAGNFGWPLSLLPPFSGIYLALDPSIYWLSILHYAVLAVAAVGVVVAYACNLTVAESSYTHVFIISMVIWTVYYVLLGLASRRVVTLQS